MDALLNWLWQGCLLAAIAAVVAGRSGICAATRYRLWWATLGLVLALPVIGMLAAPTALIELGRLPAPLSGPEAGARTSAGPDSRTVPIALAVVWTGWIGLSLLRIVVSLGRLRRIRAACRPFPAAREACLRHWWTRRAAGRRVTLAVSDRVHAAAVLGFSTPVIAISPLLLDALTDDELDQVVAHERAHVERRDDVGVLVQAVIRAVAGLHPAVWWIDRRLHIEREVACDDRVAGLVESPKRYAANLAKLAGLSAKARSWSLAPGAVRHSLRARVMRLLDPHRNRSTDGSPAAFWGAAAALVLAAAGLTRVEASEPVALPVPPAIGSAVTWLHIDLADPAGLQTARDPVPVRGRADRVRPEATATRMEPDPVPVSNPRADLPPDLVVPMPAIAAPRLPISGTALASSTRAPLAAVPDRLSVAPLVPGPSRPTPSPWTAAADAGIQIGQGARRAAVTTARFFTRAGKSFGSAF